MMSLIKTSPILFSRYNRTIFCNDDRVFILCRTSLVDRARCPIVIIHHTLPATFVQHWLNRNNHAFFQACALIRKSKMWNVWGFMKCRSDSMPGKISNDGQALTFRICLDGMTYISDPVTRLGLFNPFIERRFSYFQ